MQQITTSVGLNGTNQVSDSALVQAILVKTQRAAAANRPAGPYLASYDGSVGPMTRTAITNFQDDHVFNNNAQPANATRGLVQPNDATWAEMLAQVPAAFSEMRVLAGGRTVYVAATNENLQTKINAMNALTFTATFRARVFSCMNEMFRLHGIAVGVCPQGDRRDFQNQYNLFVDPRGVTNAGPGESNHNFGMAVDLGFAGLRWLRSNGTVVEDETPWFHRLDPGQTVMDEALRFWEALRTVGTGAVVGAFRGPVADRPHLQNWNDAGVSMKARLAVHLTASGNMNWGRANHVYTCDFGYGGALYQVGTAANIWNSQATITAAMLTQARQAAPQQPGFIRTPATQQDVTDMRTELRRQFELADTNWENWTAN